MLCSRIFDQTAVVAVEEVEMIVLENIVKKYGDRCVYDGFGANFEGVTAILGRSGCGKTTLLNMVAGLTEFDGSVTHDGAVAYMFQQPRLIKNLTVLENLVFTGADRESAEQMLGRVEVEPGLYPKQLSGGMADRVALARAFLGKAGALLMDEPFRGLDIGLKVRIMELFRTLYAERPCDVLFVTHSPLEAARLATRAVVIDRGKIIADLSDEKLTEKEIENVLVSL